MADQMTPEAFLQQVGEILGMPIDKPDVIVKVLRADRERDDQFQAIAQGYLEGINRPHGGRDRSELILRELLARDEEVKRLQQKCGQGLDG